MKSKQILIVVALGALASAVAAQHVKVFDGRTGQAGAHGAGGGGGAGKVHVHDISIMPLGNTILAFPPSFQGGVRVAVGDVDGDALNAMLKAARKGERVRGQFTLTFNGQTTPVAANGRPLASNNLKQIGLAAHNLGEMQIGFLKPAGEGQVQEYATFKVTDVTLKRGTMGGAAQRSQVTSISISFSGLEVSPAIGNANGGVWKTTNFLDRNTGETRIGLLLPAVQKVR